MKISVIIPVFNEEKTVKAILKKVNNVRLNGIEKEVVVVDDGSFDATASEIQNSKLKVKNLKMIRHKKNLGKGAAVRSGIENSSGDIIVIQDADLEYDPGDIPRLIAPLVKKKAQVVYGTRLNRMPNFLRDERSIQFFLHYLGNRCLSFLTSIFYGQWITDMETGHKAILRKVLTGIELQARGFEFEPEITAKILKRGIKILEIDIQTNPRTYDEGKKLHTFRDGFKALWTLLRYRFFN